MTVRIVSNQNTMEQFVGHKLNDADATLAILKELGPDVTSYVTEGKQWQSVTQSPITARLGVPTLNKY